MRQLGLLLFCVATCAVEASLLEGKIRDVSKRLSDLGSLGTTNAEGEASVYGRSVQALFESLEQADEADPPTGIIDQILEVLETIKALLMDGARHTHQPDYSTAVPPDQQSHSDSLQNTLDATKLDVEACRRSESSQSTQADADCEALRIFLSGKSVQMCNARVDSDNIAHPASRLHDWSSNQDGWNWEQRYNSMNDAFATAILDFTTKKNACVTSRTDFSSQKALCDQKQRAFFVDYCVMHGHRVVMCSQTATNNDALAADFAARAAADAQANANLAEDYKTVLYLECWLTAYKDNVGTPADWAANCNSKLTDPVPGLSDVQTPAMDAAPDDSCVLLADTYGSTNWADDVEGRMIDTGSCLTG